MLGKSAEYKAAIEQMNQKLKENEKVFEGT